MPGRGWRQSSGSGLSTSSTLAPSFSDRARISGRIHVVAALQVVLGLAANGPAADVLPVDLHVYGAHEPAVVASLARNVSVNLHLCHLSSYAHKPAPALPGFRREPCRRAG
jgi:hypothetical protein